jgi:hypothetical protein
MAKTPLRFSGPAQLTGTAATQYTTPSATKSIVRHIHVSNPSGSAVTLTISIGTDAAAKRVFDAFSVAAGTVLDHFCYYVLETTEIIQAFAGTASVLVLTIDGDQLTLG